MPSLTPEVCVIGGGPAGSVAARLLASWGWSVVLLHRSLPIPPLAESLPPSTRKVLALVGVADEIEAAAFLPNTGNTASWGGHERRAWSDTPGYHVPRDRWDALLRRFARAAGARLVSASVRGADPTSGCVTAIDSAGTGITVHARYILDCSGRTGIIARQGLRRFPVGYRTVALTAKWRVEAWPPDEQMQTVVASAPEAWSWSVPLSATARQCSVMLDPRRLRAGAARPSSGPEGPPRASMQAVYARELAGAATIRTHLRQARQTTRVWACDASVYDASRAAEARAVLVGDAASFIEPLSSAGVKKAMLSAWRAAVVVNTCLSDEGLGNSAFEYHDAREREVFRACARQSAAVFVEAASAHLTGFWSSRAAEAALPGDPLPLDAVAEELIGSEEVHAALVRLRSSAAARLRVSPALRLEPAPTIEGRRIVLRDALRLPGLAHPVRFAANVDLPALVDIVARHGDVASALTAYRVNVKDVAAADLLRGLSLLVARQAILDEGTRP